MTKVFDTFAILSHDHEKNQISSALGAPAMFDPVLAQNDQKYRDMIEAQLGTQIFTPFSATDPALAERQIQDAIGGGNVDRFSAHWTGTILDLTNLHLTGDLVVAQSKRATVTEIRMGGNDFSSLDAGTSPNLATITGLNDNTQLQSVEIHGSSLTSFAPFSNAANPIVDLDLSDNLSLSTVAIADGGNADDLETVDVSGCTALTMLTIGTEADSLSSVNVDGCTALTRLDIITFHTFFDVGGTTPLNSLDLSDTILTTLNLEGPMAMTSVNLQSTITTLLIVDSNIAGTLDLRPLTNLSHLTMHDNADVTAVNLHGLAHLVAVTVEDHISSIDLASSIATLAALVITGSSIPAFSISPYVHLLIFAAAGLGWSAAAVNAALIALDTAALHNGTANLAGNTAPSGAGVTAKNNLVGHGWTVQVDA